MGDTNMTSVVISIEVNVPVRTAYKQWTQFEEFPMFMEGVKEVKWTDDCRLHWQAETTAGEIEWESEVIERTLDERIIWTSPHWGLFGGVVTFQVLSDSTSKVLLQRWGRLQNAQSKMSDIERNRVASQMQRDLMRFKELIETRMQACVENNLKEHKGQNFTPPSIEMQNVEYPTLTMQREEDGHHLPHHHNRPSDRRLADLAL